MVKIGTSEKIYPLVKIALVVDALKEVGVRPEEALRGSHVSLSELYSVATRVSEPGRRSLSQRCPPGARPALRLPDRAPIPRFDLQHVRLCHPEQHEFPPDDANRHAVPPVGDAPSGNFLQRDRRQRRLDHRATATSSR